MRIHFFGITACLGLACAAQVSFEPARPISANIMGVERAYVVEVDGDPEPEIVLGSTSTGDVLSFDILSGGIAGVNRLLQGDVLRNAFYTADLNGDGLSDLITGNSGDYPFYSPYCLSVYMSAAGGGHASPICAYVGGSYNRLTSADLVGDARPELIGWRIQAVDVYTFNEVSGAMDLVRSIPESQSQTPFSADLTNDGRSELIMRTWGDAIRVWDPTTGTSGVLTTVGTNPLYLASTIRAADIDQDGWIDLIQLADSAGSDRGFIVWKNLGGLSFQRQPITLLTPQIEDFMVEDLDGDGLKEVIFMRGAYLQRAELSPDLTFSEIDTLLMVPSGFRSFSFVDLDQNGLRELLVVTKDDRLCSATGTPDPFIFSTLDTLVRWSHRTIGALVPTDVNGDGPQELALWTEGVTTTLHMIGQDPEAWLDAPYEVDLLPSVWQYSGHQLIAIDLDGDGDEDILGAQPARDPFNEQHLFALENIGGIYTFHALGAAMAMHASSRRYLFDGFGLFDVNGDGISDIIVVGRWQEVSGPQVSSAQNFVLLRTAPFTLEVGTGPLSPNQYLKGHDMDQDGDADVIELNVQDELFVVHVNDGNGQFTLADPIPADLDMLHPTWVWADIDGDGKEEMIRQARAPNDVFLYAQQTANLTLGTPLPFYEVQPGVIVDGYQFADIDGDSDADLLTWSEQVPGESVDLLSLHLSTNGSAASVGQIIHTGRWDRIVPFDMDADGDLDIAYTESASLYVLRQITGEISVDEQQPRSTMDLRLYPNPCDGSVTIDLGDVSASGAFAEIIDGTGRMVERFRLTSSLSQLDVSSIASGTYAVRVVSSEHRALLSAARLVVMRVR